jgi:hypothetical protein
MVNTLETFWAFLAAHKPALIVAFGWFIRELHIAWPFLKENRGLKGMVSILLNGSPTAPVDSSKIPLGLPPLNVGPIFTPSPPAPPAASTEPPKV